MDPNTTWEIYQYSVSEGDLDTAREVAIDLRDWIENGGFEPNWSKNQKERFLRDSDRFYKKLRLN